MSVVVAGCKVNLGLRITGLRDNGYHELNSLFWPLPHPCDTLHINETGTSGIVVHCETPGIDLGRNTLTRAYAALADAAPVCPGPGLNLSRVFLPGQALAAAAAMLRPCCTGSTKGCQPPY